MKKSPSRPVGQSAARYRGAPIARNQPPTGEWVRRIVLFGSIAFLAMVAAGLSMFAYIYSKEQIPEPNQSALRQATVVYWSDGSEMGRFDETDRTLLPASEIPDHVKKAFVAAEDATFYENSGVSFKGILRSLWGNIKGSGNMQGGSTITQQYVKNYYLTKERSYERKIREIVLALKLDQEVPKDEVLSNYLNTIHMGRNADGIQAASRKYFGVDAKDMTVEQAALVAGIIPAPNAWKPDGNEKQRAKAEERFRYVLGRMVNNGYLTKQQAAAMQVPQVLPYQSTKGTFSGPNGYILAEVRAELTKEGGPFTDDDVEFGGLRIKTTFDPTMQEMAWDAIHDEKNFPTKGRPAGVKAALVSIDSATGGVRAWYAGEDYLKRQQNNVMDDRAQAGSTFKPFALVAALEDDISLRSVYSGDNGGRTATCGNSTHEFSNYGNTAHGPMDLRKATAKSVNTVYVKLNCKVGPQKAAEVAVRAGIPDTTSGLTGDARYEVGNILGSASPRPIDLAHAYATFSAQGMNRKPHLVTEVKDPAGNVVYNANTEGSRAFSEDVMADLASALEGPVDAGGTAPRIRGQIGRDVAGKTGTSSNYRSALFAGYTPQLATVVTIYNADPQTGGELELGSWGGRKTITGGSFPASIWGAYMEKAVDEYPRENFPKPGNVGKIRGDGSSVKPKVTSRPTNGSGEPSEEGEGQGDGEEDPNADEGAPEDGEPTETPTGTPTGTSKPTKPGKPDPTTTGTGTATATSTKTNDKPPGGGPGDPDDPLDPLPGGGGDLFPRNKDN